MSIITSTDEMAPQLDGMLTSVTPILQTAAIVAGAIIVLIGVFRLFSSNDSLGNGLVTILLGFLVAGSGFILPFVANSIAEVAGDGPKPTSDPSPRPTGTSEPTRAPDTVQEPADLTWLWITLAVIVAAILVVLLVWLIVHLSTRARRGIRAAREQAEALRALQESRAATWQSYHDRHNELLRKILHAETDWDTLFFMPALSDSSVPQTLTMLRAMRTANTLRDTAGKMPTNLDDDDDLTKLPFPRAVEDFALAWEAAERHARKVGQKNVPLAERRLIKQIRTLLDMAENSAASETERNLAYKRAQALIGDLESIHIPTKAMEQLEERKLLALTSN